MARSAHRVKTRGATHCVRNCAPPQTRDGEQKAGTIGNCVSPFCSSARPGTCLKRRYAGARHSLSPVGRGQDTIEGRLWNSSRAHNAYWESRIYQCVIPPEALNAITIINNRGRSGDPTPVNYAASSIPHTRFNRSSNNARGPGVSVMHRILGRWPSAGYFSSVSTSAGT